MSNGIPDPWCSCQFDTHYYLLPYYLLTAHSNRENWTRYYLAPQFILNSCQVQQDLELQMYCHLYKSRLDIKDT